MLCPEDWIKNTQVIRLLLCHWMQSQKCKKNIWEESAWPLLLLHSRSTKRKFRVRFTQPKPSLVCSYKFCNWRMLEEFFKQQNKEGERPEPVLKQLHYFNWRSAWEDSHTWDAWAFLFLLVKYSCFSLILSLNAFLLLYSQQSYKIQHEPEVYYMLILYCPNNAQIYWDLFSHWCIFVSTINVNGSYQLIRKENKI